MIRRCPSGQLLESHESSDMRLPMQSKGEPVLHIIERLRTTRGEQEGVHSPERLRGLLPERGLLVDRGLVGAIEEARQTEADRSVRGPPLWSRTSPFRLA